MTKLIEALIGVPLYHIDFYREDVVTEREVTRILHEVRPIVMSQELTPEIREAMILAGNAALLETGYSGAFNMLNPRVVGFLSKQAGANIASITQTTRRKLARELTAGVERGEGADKLARRVKDTMSLPGVRGRARTIARTETHNAASFARLEGFKQSGLVPKKKWHATLDARVRDNHRKLHNKTVGIREVFKIRGRSAQAPGQFGVAAEDVNCRCTILPVVPRARSDAFSIHVDQDQAVDAFWRLVRRQTPGMMRAVLRGFDRWERSVIRAIRYADRS